MTFKAIHGMAPDYICKLIRQKKSTDYSSDPAKKLCLRFQEARYSQHLVVEHSVMQPQSSGTIYPARYPALTLCKILNTMWKHILLNKLLICSRVYISFILLFIINYHFISFFISLSACKFYSFLVFLTYCKAHLTMCHRKLHHISFNWE